MFQEDIFVLSKAMVPKLHCIRWKGQGCRLPKHHQQTGTNAHSASNCQEGGYELVICESFSQVGEKLMNICIQQLEEHSTRIWRGQSHLSLQWGAALSLKVQV